MSVAPVAVFGYNRADKLKMCLDALEKNELADETDLFIFADGAKRAEDSEKVGQVRDFIRRYRENSAFKEVIVVEQQHNLGLASSIIGGVTRVISKYQKVIVVEDDLIVSADFLAYMNQALDYYQDMKEYGSISAYTYPIPELKSYDKDIYVTRKGDCWGWGTWYDRWKQADWSVADFDAYLHDKKRRKAFDSIQKGIDSMLVAQQAGEIDSWAVRWCYHLFNHQLLTVYPRISRTKNIGFDGSGVHCVDSKDSDKRFNDEGYSADDNGKIFFERLPVNRLLEKKAANYEQLPWIKRLVLKIKDHIH